MFIILLIKGLNYWPNPMINNHQLFYWQITYYFFIVCILYWLNITDNSQKEIDNLIRTLLFPCLELIYISFEEANLDSKC